MKYLGMLKDSFREAVDTKVFIAAMERWRDQFRKGAELPVIGASEKDLGSIKVPTIIVPGNDKTHGHAVGEAAHRMIPGSELVDLFPGTGIVGRAWEELSRPVAEDLDDTSPAAASDTSREACA